MKAFVLDCSITMTWCFADEATSSTDTLLESLVDVQAIVPGIWPLEVANVLLVAEKRGRLTEVDASRFLSLVQTLPVTVDGATSQRALRETLSLAREQNLSSYDAAYLDLAIREGIPLATLDEGLRAAATQIGVPLAL